VITGSLVGLGQVAGLDPTDSSSTAAIALVVLPFYAAAAIGLIVGSDHLVRYVARRGHGRNGD
jgi:hypothetical protein